MANLVPMVLPWERGWGIACNINILKKIEPDFSPPKFLHYLCYPEFSRFLSNEIKYY